MIAVVLIALAAVVGQIGRWRSMLKVQDTTPKKAAKITPVKVAELDGRPELLVRFKSGINYKQVAASLNDRVEDEIESVDGLVAIDDLDDADV
jgi:hypothetical protein